MVNNTPSPWARPARLGVEIVSGSSPLLIVGQVGSLPVECAKYVHMSTGGGHFERVSCTPDASAFRIQVAGLPVDFDSEFPLIDSEPPNNAICRAYGGTLYLEFIDRCHPSDATWIQPLLSRQAVKVNGHALRLDPSTRVIASITVNVLEGVEFEIPDWLRALFTGRVVAIEPLGSRPDDTEAAIEWFSRQATREGQAQEVMWSNEARDLLVGRRWPGGLEELRNVVHSLIAVTGGQEISLDMCRDVLTQYEGPGMRGIDIYRRQQCHDYAQGLEYMGRSIQGREVYQWVEQFTRVTSSRQFDPWVVGLRIIRDIHNRYYYSSDRLRMLIRDSYGELCNELADGGFIHGRSPYDLDTTPTALQALLINPLGPVKSAAAVLPHMAHLLGAGSSQEVVSLGEVGASLKRNDSLRVILFCDDFAGTGRQIIENVVKELASDLIIKDVCKSRYREGRPVALGVVLGVGFVNALSNIRASGLEWLPVLAHAGELLREGDRAFSDESSIFPEPDLRAWTRDLVLNRIGKSLSPRWPGGFGNLQSLVVTTDNAPNDSLPAICRSGVVQGMPWKALFERASSPTV